MLAYVFWHRPREGTTTDDYIAAMSEFHASLTISPSVTFRLEQPPFEADHPDTWFEDWYPCTDWAGLGTLNERAVTGARKPPHDAVASLAADGHGAVMRCLAGDLHLHEATSAQWFGKPRDRDYETFNKDVRTRAGTHGAVWQRQMVLGPCKEYVVLGHEPSRIPWPAIATAPVRVA